MTTETLPLPNQGPDVNPAPVLREKLLKLPAALAKAQGAMESARFDAKAAINADRSYKYATLAAVMDAMRKPFTDNGLCFTQLPTTTEQGGKAGVMVITRLIHESGEELVNRLWLPVMNPTPQGYGSAITYAKRYALCAIAGVATDDDDANEATRGNHPVGPALPPKQPAKAPKAKEAPSEPEAEPEAAQAPSQGGLEAEIDAAKTLGEMAPLPTRIAKAPEAQRKALIAKYTEKLNELKKSAPRDPGEEG
jgi:hypothetical protein